MALVLGVPSTSSSVYDTACHPSAEAVARATIVMRMRLESLRKDTYEFPLNPLLDNSAWTPWPDEACFSFQTLAGHGFYYTGVRQIIKCTFCFQQFNVEVWLEDTDIESEHRKVSPHCPFLVDPNCKNISIKYEYDAIHNLGMTIFRGAYSFKPDQTFLPLQNYKDLSIMARTMFYNLAMVKKTSRYASFNRGWGGPPNMMESLAEAGFYFIGPKSCVQCYLCGLFLTSLNPEHNPFELHAFYGPACTHIPLVVGPSYVDKVQGVIAEKYLKVLHGAGASDWFLCHRTSNQLAKNFNFEDSNGLFCCMCEIQKANITLFPCHHTSTCGKCTADTVKCPQCKQPFTYFTWTIISCKNKKRK